MLFVLIGVVALACALGLRHASAQIATRVVVVELDDAGSLRDADLLGALGRELGEYRVLAPDAGAPAPSDAVRLRVVAEDGTLRVTATWPDGRVIRRAIARPEFPPDAVATTCYVAGTMLRAQDDVSLPSPPRTLGAPATRFSASLGLGGGASLGAQGADTLPATVARIGGRWGRVGLNLVGTFMPGEPTPYDFSSLTSSVVSDTPTPLRDYRMTLGVEYWLLGPPGSRAGIGAGALAGLSHERNTTARPSPTNVDFRLNSVDEWRVVGGGSLCTQVRLSGALGLEARVEVWRIGDATVVDALALIIWGMP